VREGLRGSDEGSSGLSGRELGEGTRGAPSPSDPRARPEFAKLVYWSHFVLVSCIFGRFGLRNNDGSRAVYELCSQARARVLIGSELSLPVGCIDPLVPLQGRPSLAPCRFWRRSPRSR